MDWKKLALCMSLAGVTVACGGDPEPIGEPVTRRYIVSSIEIPAVSGTDAIGFNLDDTVSTGEGTSCVELTPDYNSINDPGEDGVDNALAGLVPQLGMLIGDSCPAGTPAAECLSALLSQQIAEGSVLLVMEVTDINSFANDSSISLQLFLGTVPGCVDTDPTTCAPMLEGGTIAPGQTFDVMAVGTAVPGSITNGRMTAITESLTISINTSGLALDLVLRNAEVRANITDGSLTNGAIGGSLRVQDIADAAEAIEPGLGETVLNILGNIADMEPQAADESMCDALSAGIKFAAVDAAEPD